MGKKKSESAKSRPPRKKKLRLVDNSPIGLTEEEILQLRELYSPLSNLRGFDVNDTVGNKRLIMDRCLYLYVEGLCHDARSEISKVKRGRTTTMRRQIVSQLGRLRGRDVSPDDIIKELARHAPVPSFAARAIRRDFLRVTV